MIIRCGATHAGSSKLFTMEHLSHVHPLGSLVEQTQERLRHHYPDAPDMQDIEPDAEPPETPAAGAG